jgi:signal transduction histidine kinase/CheY-like chemotaxis protein
VRPAALRSAATALALAAMLPIGAFMVPAGHAQTGGGNAEPASEAIVAAMGSAGQPEPDLAESLNDPLGSPSENAYLAAAMDAHMAGTTRRDGSVLGIAPGVFWREIFPGMLLLFAIAAGMSFGYAQLRREVMRRRAAEVRLQAARDLADSASLAQSTFFATMSHEIRTPLSGIIGMLDLLKRASMGAQQRQMLLAVDTAATSLLQILDQVMDFSKVEANRMSLESVPVDLRALIQSVVMVMGEPARRRGVRTRYEIDDAVCQEILGDPLRIRQILTNLVSNAAKFTAQGEVRLTLAVDAADAEWQTLRFVVMDTGIGIPAEKLAQVMMPFRQADASTSRHYGGSGLGLSVSSRLAVLMGGQLTLGSVPGEGTRACFVCRFPVHRGQPAIDGPAGEMPRLPAQRGGKSMAVSVSADGPGGAGCFGAGGAIGPVSSTAGLPTDPIAPAADAHERGTSAIPPALPRLLVVDDHAINRDLMRRQLATLGYDCDTRPDGRAALEALRSGGYALLLTDCQMPAMGGAELARAWREEERRRGVAGEARMPIVIVTAKTEPARPGGLDIDARIRKPITLNRLRAVLQECLPPAALTAALARSGAPLAAAAPRAGLDLPALRGQFGDNDAALRQFLQASVAALRADVTEAQVSLCPEFCGRFGDWLHRALGALSMLGHWPVVDEGNALEEALRAAPGPDLLPEMLPFLQRFADTVNDLDRQVQRI